MNMFMFKNGEQDTEKFVSPFYDSGVDLQYCFLGLGYPDLAVFCRDGCKELQISVQYFNIFVISYSHSKKLYCLWKFLKFDLLGKNVGKNINFSKYRAVWL